MYIIIIITNDIMALFMLLASKKSTTFKFLPYQYGWLASPPV